MARIFLATSDSIVFEFQKSHPVAILSTLNLVNLARCEVANISTEHNYMQYHFKLTPSSKVTNPLKIISHLKVTENNQVIIPTVNILIISVLLFSLSTVHYYYYCADFPI